MPQQDQWRAGFHAGARAVDHVGQVVDQARLRRQRAAHAVGFAVAVLVVAAHGKAPAVQAPRDMVVTSRVLAQAMHQHHDAARRHAFGQGQSCIARLFPSLAVNVESVDSVAAGFMAGHDDRWHAIPAQPAADQR